MKITAGLRLPLIAVAVACSFPIAAQADLCEKTPAVNLNAVSSEEVDNDMVRLSWQVQIQAGTANEAMSAVNTVLEKSIASLSRNKEISKLRNNLQTYPQYNGNQQIQGWQGVGTLVFEMPVEALKNQKSLNVADGLALSNLEYFPGEAKVEKSREKLSQLAIREFQSKANMAASAFGKTGYTLGEVSIQDENFNSPMAPRMFAASADMGRGKSMEIAQAAGTSRLSVAVNGRVCLKP